MGRLSLTYLSGTKIYACSNCKAHLTNYDDIVSKSFQVIPHSRSRNSHFPRASRCTAVAPGLPALTPGGDGKQGALTPQGGTGRHGPGWAACNLHSATPPRQLTLNAPQPRAPGLSKGPAPRPPQAQAPRAGPAPTADRGSHNRPGTISPFLPYNKASNCDISGFSRYPPFLSLPSSSSSPPASRTHDQRRVSGRTSGFSMEKAKSGKTATRMLV